MPLLKADLHIHTSEDPQDVVFYSAVELIDMAHGLGYSVLSITNHDHLTYSGYLRDYAKERGIVLIPGMEATIEGRHVLLYNLDFASVDRGSLRGLRGLKTPQGLVIAPHPYYPSPKALRGLLRPNITLFDAIEFCHFYTEHLSFNRAAQRIAEECRLPMVGTSDAHQRSQFHTTYSLIDAEPDPESIVEAVKSGRVRVVTRP
ncbi:MAG: PHP-associated domain-containing protein, partial [Dissulfurimicrobium sp.]